jgi:lactoylglutathione lyase
MTTAIEIELTHNKGSSEAYTQGAGYGRVAVVVFDAAATHAELTSMGCEPTAVKEFKRGDELLAPFLFN